MPPTSGLACAIIAPAQFLPPADVDTFLRALARLFDLDWTLTIAGAGADWHGEAPRALAQTLDIAGRLHFTDTPDWGSAALFACAVEPPTLDIAAAEAFRRGLPIVAIATEPGIHITPETGVVVPSGNVEQLSRSLRRLIFDTNLRREITEAARAAGQSLSEVPGL